jgi:hypothetical protein
MSIRTFVSRSLLTGTLVTLASTAFARQPAALVAAQRNAEREIACEGAPAQPGAGYRDALVRFGVESQTATARAGGYRDALARFGQQGVTLVACTTPMHGPHASASR